MRGMKWITKMVMEMVLVLTFVGDIPSGGITDMDQSGLVEVALH